MSTPIEALAQEKERARNEWFGHRCQHSTPQATSAADGFNAGFEAGAKAASGRVAELEEALRFYTQPKIINSQGSGWQENIYCPQNLTIISEEDFGFTALQAISGAGKGEG